MPRARKIAKNDESGASNQAAVEIPQQNGNVEVEEPRIKASKRNKANKPAKLKVLNESDAIAETVVASGEKKRERKAGRAATPSELQVDEEDIEEAAAKKTKRTKKKLDTKGEKAVAVEKKRGQAKAAVDVAASTSKAANKEDEVEELPKKVARQAKKTKSPKKTTKNNDDESNPKKSAKASKSSAKLKQERAEVPLKRRKQETDAEEGQPSTSKQVKAATGSRRKKVTVAEENGDPEEENKEKLIAKKGKQAKKKEEVDTDGELSEESEAVKVDKPKAGKAKKGRQPKEEEEAETPANDSEKSAVNRGGRKRKAKAAGPTEEDGAKTLKNATSTEYDAKDFALDKPHNLKISSWNVAGLRSWIKKDGLKFLDYETPDIFCLQEIKCTLDQIPEEVKRITGYHPYWLCMPGGYAGVAIYSKIMPINVEYGIGNKEFDDAGRIITAEYEKFYLINVYVPNSGRKLVNLEPRMRWEKLFQEHVQKYDALKPVIICGDMNCSHEEIDLANPKTNTRNAGFTKEEREKFTELLSLGYVDTFRHLYPTRTGAYTFWTYMANARARNVGWRLDYFLVSERIAKRVVENAMRSHCKGSDHCPITLFLNL